MLDGFAKIFKLKTFSNNQMSKINLIMLGAPGSGKGTRASALCEILNIVQVSTGDLFRHNIKNGTQLGKLADSFIKKGELVPDAITADMVADRLTASDVANGFILDGFPRNLVQADMLEEILQKRGEKITAVLSLNVSEEEILKRISGRLVCKTCQSSFHKIYNPPAKEGVCDKCGGELFIRDDDKEETVKNRMKVFTENTLPLVDYYTEKGILLELPSEITEAGVASDMLAFAKKQGFVK